jgi:hypothetical protein
MMGQFFSDRGNYARKKDLLKTWIDDSRRIKEAFTFLSSTLARLPGVSLDFHSRPGITHSFRAFGQDTGKRAGRLIGLVDIVDDDPNNRWLSICFYSNTVSDPQEAGNLLPGGLLGEDGYCFDLFEYDDEFLSYLEKRIAEAFANGVPAFMQ